MAVNSMRALPRFVADAMQGSLARKLRIFGFDTLYFMEGEDAELEALARKENRVILTSDKSLFRHARARRIKAILIEGRTDTARLLCVVKLAGPREVRLIGRPGASRCAVCNGELEILGKKYAAAAGMPAKALARHRLFFRCTSCSRLYWRGKHWKRLGRLSSSVRTKALT